VRDRRWDYLYERQKQPVKAFVLERFAEELAKELEGWPPPFVDWVSDELRARYAAGAAERPRDELLRRALELARLDLAREHEAYERLLREDGPGRPRTAAEEAAVHLLVLLLTERCLALKEHADRLKLARADLAGALEQVERRLFRVTLA
jgi:hypothetical protein